MDIHVCHMNNLVLVNDCQGGVFGPFLSHSIKLFDDRHKLRNNGLQIMSRPFFQGFGKDCVVCVSTGICNNLHCFFKIDIMKHKQTDQFRDHHARVCIVDLDRSIVSEIVIITSSCDTFRKNKLCTGGNHEILLIDTEQTSVFVGIIRIEEKSQVFGNVLFVKGDSFTDHGFINSVQVKKIQGVGSSFISCNRKLIKSCRVFLSCQRYWENSVCSLSRTGIGQPEIRSFILDIVFEVLVKKTAMVAKSYTVARKI